MYASLSSCFERLGMHRRSKDVLFQTPFRLEEGVRRGIAAGVPLLPGPIGVRIRGGYASPQDSLVASVMGITKFQRFVCTHWGAGYLEERMLNYPRRWVGRALRKTVSFLEWRSDVQLVIWVKPWRGSTWNYVCMKIRKAVVSRLSCAQGCSGRFLFQTSYGRRLVVVPGGRGHEQALF